MFESLRGIESEDIQRWLLTLPTTSLQYLYDAYGRDTTTLRTALGIKTKPRKLAVRLADHGVTISKRESKKLGMSLAPIEDSGYSLFELGDDFDPEKLMEEVIESDLDPSIFEDMDFRELPWANNILEWIIGRQFLDAAPFPRQLQMLLAFFEEYCPYCSDMSFVKDMHLSPYLGEDGYQRPWTIGEMQDRITFLLRKPPGTSGMRYCPKCKKTYIEMLGDKKTPHRAPTEMDCNIGQRSGKTRMTEMAMTYTDHLSQGLGPSPQRFYGEDPVQKFSAMVTAMDLSQASDTLWGAYHLRVNGGAPWYRTYHEWLDFHGKKIGAELYTVSHETYHFYHPTLLEARLRPPFAKAMRGRTGYMMGIDEIGLFAKQEGAVRANADEVHRSMNNSLLTLREDGNTLRRKGVCAPAVPMFCISSPWEILDKIMTLVRSADSDPTRVGFQYATWEVNPKLRRDSPQIQAEFQRDPVAAERDYGAIPPFAKDPYHERPEIIDAMVVKTHQPIFRQQLKHGIGKNGNAYVYAFPQNLRVDKVTPRIIIIDGGESDNSFAVTIWSLVELPAPALDIGFDEPTDNDWCDDEDIQAVISAIKAHTVELGGPVYPKLQKERGGSVEYLQLDGAIEVQPFVGTGDHHFRVNFKRMWESCLEPLIDAFHIVLVASDRWNMTQIKNSVEDKGVDYQRYSLTWADFEDFREKVDSRELRLLSPERPFEAVLSNYDDAVRDAPALHLLVQMKTVRRVGRAVTKPSGGTDDLYRTAVLAHYFAFSEDAISSVDGKTTINTLLKTFGKGHGRKYGLAVVQTRSNPIAAGANNSGKFSSIGGYTTKGNASGNSYGNVKTKSNKH